MRSKFIEINRGRRHNLCFLSLYATEVTQWNYFKSQMRKRFYSFNKC
jgi:hypothetical protein